MSFRMDVFRTERSSKVIAARSDAQVIDLRRVDRDGRPTCPKCETSARVDWIDLVRGTSFLHCPGCRHMWEVGTVVADRT